MKFTVHEKGSAKKRGLENHTHIDHGGKLVWNSGSTEHPRNWTRWPKAYTTIFVVWLEFFMTAISSSGTAAAKGAIEDYPMSETLSYFVFITLYLLGQAIGGIFCSPISEVFGRRTIYIIATAMFGICSVVVGTPPSVIAVYLGRFFQGVAAAIPATVAFGQFNDMFDADLRIWIVYAYTVFGMAGIALGPIFATYVTLKLGWRWVFHISAIASGISLIFCLFMKESNASRLLQQEAKAISKTSEEPVHADGDDQKPKSKGSWLRDFFQDQLYRPTLFLFTEPLVMVCSILCAVAFGLSYGMTESLTIVYTTPPFDEVFSKNSASFAFLAILLGEVLDVIPRIYDDIALTNCRLGNKRIKPETKIHSFAVACPVLAIGLWIFAWTIPTAVTDCPWPISMIGLVCIGFAANDFSYVLFGYITDAYGDYAASAVGALSTARSVTAAVFPLFMTQMYEGLGNNHATTVFAAIATAFCLMPILLLGYGEKLRSNSKYTVKEDCLPEENAHLERKRERRNEF